MPSSLLHPLPARPCHLRKNSAAALIVTLIFLVLIAIMILAMTDALRVERVALTSYLGRTQADLMAERGIEQVVATLNKETADVNRNWISQPGQLILGAEKDDADTGTPTPYDDRKVLTGATLGETSPTKPKIVLLNSGVPSAAILASSEKVFLPPNLNIPTWSKTSEHLITDRVDSTTSEPILMRVKWIYMRQDGTLDFSETPVTDNAANPIVGRYAFWTDDESGKINMNLAWSRTNTANTLSEASPTRISLAALPGFSEEAATTLHNSITEDNFATIKRTFNSPDDPRQVTSLADALRDNKFEITHYNHDPGTTFFNEKRIVLTTQKANAGSNPFLDILTTENTDPGYIGNLSLEKVNNTIKLLVPYLQRTDWPMVAPSATPKSFQSKYFSGDASRLVQLALGIIEYVRSAESAKKIVEPLRLIWIPAANQYQIVTTSAYTGWDNTFIGVPRKFHMTELAVWCAQKNETTGPNAGRRKVRFYIEVHLPKNYGMDAVNLLEPEEGKKLFVYIKAADRAGKAYNALGQDAYTANVNPASNPPDTGNNSYEVTASNIIGGSAGTMLTPGGYRTLVFEFWLPSTPPPPTPAHPETLPSFPDTATSATFNLRYALLTATGQGKGPGQAGTAMRFEVVPLGDVESVNVQALSYTALLNIPEPASIDQLPVGLRSLETNDPRVNAIAQDWKVNSVKTNTFGAQNKKNLSGAAPSITADLPEQDTDAAGKVSTASLRMPYPKGDSRNPLGLVLSPGELGYVHTGLEGQSKNSTGGIPWRTLRLQPNRYSDTTEVPDWALMDLFTVPKNVPTVAATLFSPHGSATAGRVNMNAEAAPFGMERLLPLQAVLLNAAKDSTDPAKKLTAAEAKTIATAIYNHTLSPKKNNDLGKHYGYVNGYDSPGEIAEIAGVADGGEQSEELVRSISNLLTTRGNVFSIYTIGQSIKQTSKGKLVITGEERKQAMVERYLASDNTVNFRNIYLRSLNP